MAGQGTFPPQFSGARAGDRGGLPGNAGRVPHGLPSASSVPSERQPLRSEAYGPFPYSPESVAEAVAEMGRFWPVMGLGADILMGFPGETEEETEETLAMLRSLPVTYAHVFPYSERPGTKAASLPGGCPKR